LYDFQRQWYPVGVVSDFNRFVAKREPIRIDLLGKRYAVWKKDFKSKEETDDWSVTLDICPHRLAPLTEGRICDSGNLMCSYHGWEFEAGTGACASIPQAPESTSAKICSNSSCSLTLLPAKVKYGLLFVWPDTSAAGIEQSKTCEPMEIEPLEAIESESIETMSNQWYMRDITYDWDTFVENIVDPTHVPFAHHGIQGRRERPGSQGLRLDSSSMDGGVKAMMCPKDPKDDVGGGSGSSSSSSPLF